MVPELETGQEPDQLATSGRTHQAYSRIQAALVAISAASLAYITVTAVSLVNSSTETDAPRTESQRHLRGDSLVQELNGPLAEGFGVEAAVLDMLSYENMSIAGFAARRLADHSIAASCSVLGRDLGTSFWSDAFHVIAVVVIFLCVVTGLTPQISYLGAHLPGSDAEAGNAYRRTNAAAGLLMLLTFCGALAIGALQLCEHILHLLRYHDASKIVYGLQLPIGWVTFAGFGSAFVSIVLQAADTKAAPIVAYFTYGVSCCLSGSAIVIDLMSSADDVNRATMVAWFHFAAVLALTIGVLGFDMGRNGCNRLYTSSREWRLCCGMKGQAPPPVLASGPDAAQDGQDKARVVLSSVQQQDLARDMGVLLAILLIGLTVALGNDVILAHKGAEHRLQPSGELIQMVLIRWVPVVACSFLPIEFIASDTFEDGTGNEGMRASANVREVSADGAKDSGVASAAAPSEAPAADATPESRGEREGARNTKPCLAHCCSCLLSTTEPVGLSTIVRCIASVSRWCNGEPAPAWIAPVQLSMHAWVKGYIVVIFASLLVASASDCCIGPIGHLSGWAVLARAPALPLQVWLPVLLALVRLHASRRALRFELGAAHLLPLDDAAELHRTVAWIGFVLFALHIIGHVGNLAVWADGPDSMPDVVALVGGTYPKFFDLIAGQSVWAILWNNFAVATGIVLTISFMTMLILSEEKITRQRCPTWCSCSRKKACCVHMDMVKDERTGATSPELTYCRVIDCLACARITPSTKQTVVMCCCEQGPEFASRTQLTKEADQALNRLVIAMHHAESDSEAEAEGETVATPSVRDAGRPVGLGSSGVKCDGEGVPVVAPNPCDKARKVTKPTSYRTSGDYPSDAAAGTRYDRLVRSISVGTLNYMQSKLTANQVRAAAGIVDKYMAASKTKTTTSYGCFRLVKRACSVVGLAAWLMHGASGVLGDPLVGSLTAGGVMVLTYIAAELLDFWLGQGGCLSASRVQVIAPSAYSVSGRILEEADGVLPDDAATVAFHEASELLQRSAHRSSSGCRPPAESGRDSPLDTEKRRDSRADGKDGNDSDSVLSQSSGMESSSRDLRGALERCRRRLQASVQRSRDVILEEITFAGDDIKRGRAVPKRWMTVSIDTAGPQWEMQQLDVLRAMEPTDVVAHIGEGIRLLDMAARDEERAADVDFDALLRYMKAGHGRLLAMPGIALTSPFTRTGMLKLCRSVYTELFYARARALDLPCGWCPTYYRTWFFTETAVELGLQIRARAACVHAGEYVYLGLYEAKWWSSGNRDLYGGGHQQGTVSWLGQLAAKSALPFATRPFTVAAQLMDTDGTPSGLEMHIDCAGNGEVELGESVTRSMYEMIMQSMLRSRINKIRWATGAGSRAGHSGMQWEKEGAQLPTLLLHGPCPAPAVRPASGRVNHVLAFASGFGITNSMALMTHYLWKFGRGLHRGAGNAIVRGASGTLPNTGEVSSSNALVLEGALGQLRKGGATSAEQFDVLTTHGHSMVLGWVTNDLGHAKRVIAELGTAMIVATAGVPRRVAQLVLNRVWSRLLGRPIPGMDSLFPTAASLHTIGLGQLHEHEVEVGGSGGSGVGGAANQGGFNDLWAQDKSASAPNLGSAAAAKSMRLLLGSAQARHIECIPNDAATSAMEKQDSLRVSALNHAEACLEKQRKRILLELEMGDWEVPERLRTRTEAIIEKQKEASKLAKSRWSKAAGTAAVPRSRSASDADVASNGIQRARAATGEGAIASWAAVAARGVGIAAGVRGMRQAKSRAGGLLARLRSAGLTNTPGTSTSTGTDTQGVAAPPIAPTSSKRESFEADEGQGSPAGHKEGSSTEHKEGLHPSMEEQDQQDKITYSKEITVTFDEDDITTDAIKHISIGHGAAGTEGPSSVSNSRPSPEGPASRPLNALPSNEHGNDADHVAAEAPSNDADHVAAEAPMSRPMNEAGLGSGDGKPRVQSSVGAFASVFLSVDGGRGSKPGRSMLQSLHTWLPRLGHGKLRGFDAKVYLSASPFGRERHVGKLASMRKETDLLFRFSALLGVKVVLYDRKDRGVPPPTKERVMTLANRMNIAGDRERAAFGNRIRTGECVYCGASMPIVKQLRAAASQVGKGNVVEVSHEVFA